MPLKKSVGNMYPWVTHTHSHLGGECPHRCAYCYVNNPRFGRPPRYTGDLRLVEGEFGVKYGEGKSIFIEHCNDLFANEVPAQFVSRVLAHCRTYPKNEYIFQSKNPGRIEEFLPEMPERVLFGTTIESNRWHKVMGNAPAPLSRAQAAQRLHQSGSRLFVTIEPILDFDVAVMLSWLCASATFVNIGADSKGHGLPEPDGAKVLKLISNLQANGVEIRKKHNLGRLTD